MSNKKTAIVTGASSGIGLCLAKSFLADGYNVVATSRTVTSTGTLSPADNLALVDGDIADPNTVARIVDAVEGRFGRLDVFVNSAGIFVPKPFTDYTAADVDRVLSTNVAGFFFVSQAAVTLMRRNGGGSIVNISTTLVDQPIAGVNAALSILSKGALNAFTRALAIEYAGEGIRVNAVAAGIVDTPMHQSETHAFLKTLHPIQRIATVDEIADAVHYLVDASFVTGEVMHVDGGAHAGRW